MLWRLFVTMIVMSDTSSVSVSQDNSDFPSQQACINAQHELYREPNHDLIMNGRAVHIHSETRCVGIMRGEQPMSMVR
jgi:hypothetical protein